MRKFLSIVMSAALAIFLIMPVSIRAKAESEFLDYQDNSSDCEGRIFSERNIGARTTTTDTETLVTTIEAITTTTAKTKGTTEVNTHPTALDWATDFQTSTCPKIKEEITVERETSTEGSSNDQSGTTTDGIPTGTEITTTIGTDGTIYTTTISETTTIGAIEESPHTGDSVNAGKIAGTCGLAMIVGLLAICGKKEE